LSRKAVTTKPATIRRSVLDELPSEAVLDMLRYDGSRVENNRPDGFWLFSFEPATNPRTPFIEPLAQLRRVCGGHPRTVQGHVRGA
jgi:hypothetical protein